MLFDALTIANEFIDLASKNDKGPLTQMKLQKLVYFAHGWHLGLWGTPLLDEVIQAWSYGPVVRTVYNEFRDFGVQPITKPQPTVIYTDDDEPTERIVTPRLDDCSDGMQRERTRGFLRRIWDLYGDFTALQLMAMTHEPGGPWDQVNRKHNGNLPKYEVIPDDIIRNYFAAKVKGSK